VSSRDLYSLHLTYVTLLTIESSALSLWCRHDDTPSSNTAVSSTPPAAARGGTAPHAGKIVVPEGAAHGYELVEQLTALPQRRVHDGRSSSLATLRHGSTASEWQPGDDWGADDAPGQRWLDAGGGSGIEGFCAADLHPAAAFPQLAPAASALVEVLAGLPMRIGQEPGAAADDTGPHAAAGQLEHRDHGSSHSASRSQEGQDLQDYSLQDSFARGHFGEGRPACLVRDAQGQTLKACISSARHNVSGMLDAERCDCSVARRAPGAHQGEGRRRQRRRQPAFCPQAPHGGAWHGGEWGIAVNRRRVCCRRQDIIHGCSMYAMA
jgi:hypothetical protein